MKITIDVLDQKSIARGIRELKSYKSDIRKKADELCYKLCEMGATFVSLSYEHVHPFVSDKGDKDYKVSVTRKGNHFYIRVSGSDVLFLEFGSGDRYGGGQSGAFYADAEGFVTSGADAPYGPGTFNPESYNWINPHGWHTPKGQRSFGNPASGGMYYAKRIMEDRLKELAEEIFNG